MATTAVMIASTAVAGDVQSDQDIDLGGFRFLRNRIGWTLCFCDFIISYGFGSLVISSLSDSRRRIVLIRQPAACHFLRLCGELYRVGCLFGLFGILELVLQ
jgi:hypothetical protein